MHLYIVWSIVLASLSGSCFALQCYKCDGKGCAYPVDPAIATIETCQSDVDKCVAFQDFTGRTFRDCGFSWQYGSLPTSYCRTIKTEKGDQTACGMFCDDDMCNSQAFADVVDDTLNCYDCTYDEGYPSSTDCSSTNFNPKAIDMATLTCDGTCMIESRQRRGRFILTRSCLPKSKGVCIPGCNEYGHCIECCNTNLCNTPSK